MVQQMIRSDLILPLVRVFLLALAALVALIVAEKRWRLLSSFRDEPSSALNLAIARIAVMSTLLSKISLRSEVSYSVLDKSLIVPPIGWSHLAVHVPRNPDLITILYVLFVAFSALAIVGLYGRLASLLASAAGFYLLTLPQLFGKINHDHNLILFGFILAASPCCDTLSVDAIRNALRTGRSGTYVSAPIQSTAYGDPLKTMMVLMGLIYFFPGAWKLGRLGIHWFSADNMRWTIARKLLEAPYINPIQAWAMRHPTLLLLGAIFTPVFELGFVFAIFSRRTRLVAAACGIAFHSLIGMLMNISFLSLQLCYVIFVDWTSMLSSIASRMKINRITVGRIGRSELIVLNVVSKFDWLNLVSVESLDMPVANGILFTQDAPGLTVIDEKGASISGYEAYISITKRIVVLWPLYLCLSSALLRKFGASAYQRFSQNRERQNLKMTNAIELSPSCPRNRVLVRLLSGAFIIGMILAGLSHSVNAWPFACYPTFDHLETGQVSELSVTATGDDGHVYRQTLSFDPKIARDMSPERYDAMVTSLMRQDAPVSKERAAALVNLWREKYNYPPLKEVTLYSDTFTLDSDGKLGRVVENREVTHLGKEDGLE
jgi:hypothetical protein